MTREDFDLLVGRIERQYAGRPGRLRLAVIFWALVGYGWFAGWILLVFLIAGSLFAAGISAGPDGVAFHVLGGVVLAGGLVAIWRSVRVKLGPIEGRRVTQPETPALFRALSGLREKLKTIPFHRVMIVTDLNASVVQLPRLGVFGWWKNYLLLGMPMLEALSEKEFLAVLAHEFAHLSHQHGRMSHWLYRLRRAWERVFTGLQQRGAAGKRLFSLRALSGRFARWFWPRFNAHAFVLSRANEYEADRVAAELTGAQSVMSALSRFAANREYLDDKFWPGIRQLAAGMPEPPADLMSYFRAALGTNVAAGQLEELWKEELRGVTTNADTHPCLNDRLKALGWDGKNLITSFAGPSAAEVFLAGALDTIRADMNAIWRKELAKNWSAQNAKAAVFQHRLGSISSTGRPADADTLWDQACMRMELEKTSEVEPLLREILNARPSHVGALIALGKSLLERNDPEGAGSLERAMDVDEDCVPHACNLLLDYFRRIGDTEGMRKIRLRMDQYDATLAASREERSTVTARDPLIPHGLTAAELEPLLTALKQYPEIKAVHLGRKKLKYFVKQPLFLLCIRLEASYRSRERAIISKLSLSNILPGRSLIFAPRETFSAIARNLERVPGSKIEGQ